MNLKKIVLLSGLITLTISAVEVPPIAHPEIAQESNSKFKELKKLINCFKSKDGCSKKQAAIIVSTVAGIVLLITGGGYLGYRLLRKNGKETSKVNVFEMFANDQLTPELLTGISKKQINAKNEKGQTVLMLAVEKSDTDLMQKLISLGANIRATDKEGKTVADYIRDEDMFTSIYFLINKVYPKEWIGSQAEKEAAVADYIAGATESEPWQELRGLIQRNLPEKEANKLIKNVEDRLQQQQVARE